MTQEHDRGCDPPSGAKATGPTRQRGLCRTTKRCFPNEVQWEAWEALVTETWSEQFVDAQVDRAPWLSLRMDLAERFAVALAGGSMGPVDISTATGKSLTVQVDDGYVHVMV